MIDGGATSIAVRDYTPLVSEAAEGGVSSQEQEGEELKQESTWENDGTPHESPAKKSHNSARGGGGGTDQGEGRLEDPEEDAEMKEKAAVPGRCWCMPTTKRKSRKKKKRRSRQQQQQQQQPA